MMVKLKKYFKIIILKFEGISFSLESQEINMSSSSCPGALQSNSSSSDNVCFSTNCQVQPSISFQLKFFLSLRSDPRLYARGEVESGLYKEF